MDVSMPPLGWFLIAVFLFFFLIKPAFQFFTQDYLPERAKLRAQKKQKHLEEVLSTTLAELQNEQETPAPEEPDPLPLEEPTTPPDGVLVGTDTDTNEPLYIPDALRGKHLYLIGKTRTGKTTLIKNIIVQTIEQGQGTCVIDPHGELADEVLTTVPEERIKDVIYFDPTKEWCPPFNVLALPYPPYKLTEDIISVFKLFFGESWGYRLEHILRYSILTLINCKNPTTILDLRKILTSEKHREHVLSAVDDQALLDFWKDEFPRMGKTAPDPIINKLSTFLVPSSPMFRLFSQPTNGLDFPQILKEQKILVVNLAKGKVGDEPSKLLGGMIAAGIQGAALALADTDPAKRKTFHFFIDEFQNYAVKSMEDILSESAKYKLFLTLAHQTTGQINSSMQHAILGNVATLVAFQISATDAQIIGREMRRVDYQYRRNKDEPFMPAPAFLNKIVTDIIESWHETTRLLQQQLAKGDLPTHEWDRKERQIADMKNDIIKYKEMLQQALTTGNADELLTDFKVGEQDKKEVAFPATHDFINMQPRHAFIRKERAENVAYFKTNAPPPPVAGVKGKILHNMRELYAERQHERPQPTPRKSNVVQLRPQAQEEPAGVAEGVTITKKPALQKPQRKPQKEKLTF